MKALFAALVLTGAIAGVHAQSPIDAMTADELVKRLANPVEPESSAPTTRSIRARNLQAQPASVDLNIQFDFDSARIQTRSESLLNELATAMQHPTLQTKRFAVEGHTDAKGTATYNQALSERRAQAVVRYLMTKGVTPDRLNPVGFGMDQPLQPEDPLAAVNRRVRIVTQ